MKLLQLGLGIVTMVLFSWAPTYTAAPTASPSCEKLNRYEKRIVSTEAFKKIQTFSQRYLSTELARLATLFAAYSPWFTERLVVQPCDLGSSPTVCTHNNNLVHTFINKNLVFFNTTTRQKICSYTPPLTTSVEYFQYSPTKDAIALLLTNNSLEVVDLQSGTKRWTWSPPTSGTMPTPKIENYCWTVDAKRSKANLYVSLTNNQTYHIDGQTGHATQHPSHIPPQELNQRVFSANGLAFGGGNDGYLAIYNMASKQTYALRHNDITRWQWLPNSKTILVIRGTREIIVKDYDSNEIGQTWIAPAPIRNCTISPKGDIIAVIFDAMIIFLDNCNGALRGRTWLLPDALTSAKIGYATWSPDDSCLVIGLSNGAAHILRIDDAEPSTLPAGSAATAAA